MATKKPPVETSFHNHEIKTETFRENTIIRRLKGLKIVDDGDRDEDHPRNRKK